ncbi:MAG: LysM peptidoglycan-binding domain-containing protein [Verrucomicrobiota bacterium]
MRPLITVTAVVILHLCVLAVLVGVNGCRSTSGHEVDSPADLAAFSGGLRRAQLPTKVVAAPAAAPVSAPVVAAPAPALATPPAAALVGSAKAAPGETITVMKGETLFAIAKRQGVSVAQLASSNGLPLNATLREGQRLKIPAPGQSGTAAKAAPKSAPKAAPKSAAPAPAPVPPAEPFKLTIIGSPAAPKSAAPAPAPAPAPKAAN